MRTILAGIILLTAGAAARANVAGGGNEGPDVTITKQGNNVILSNGIISATIDPANATVLSMKVKGHEMVSTAGQHKSIYFSRDGGADFETLPHCTMSLATNTPDVIDVACKHIYEPGKDKHAWDVGAHFVLCRGATGLYVYTVTVHPANYPALGLGEWRMVWSTPETGKDVMEKIYIDQARHWVAPLPEDFKTAVETPIKEITKMTQGTWAGKYDCKYMYNANYSNLGCWGFASDKHPLGEFVVFGSHEFFSDGPTKNDLTAAVGTILTHMNMNHYNGSSQEFKQGEVWSKIYGPFLLYCNDKPTGDAAWADAEAQAKAEEAAWPYEWVNNALYPKAKERGTVTGQLEIRDLLKPSVNAAGAWVGLTPPHGRPTDDWQFQGDGYQYWTRAGADGTFTIPAVRPGTYVLHAFNTGAVGECAQQNVVVTAGQTTNLNNVMWIVPHHGRAIAWEIGVPDRSAAEFRHGKDYYLPYLYKTAPNELSNPLDYTIGKSDPAKDWNYAQSRYMQGDKPVPQRWRIHFDLPGLPVGPATLTLAFASADRARVDVYANDESRPITTVTPDVEGGNALLREAIHAKYCVSYVPIPVNHLKVGPNTIELVQTSVREDASHVMYDYLSLELP
ncbi:MAG TPA: polysaccharide lyase family protein [Phycisphaerae bacterium]|nr:polysaccharide lyase family protein [Phycisphaerae bacterium]